MNKLDRIGQKSVLYQIQTILLDEIDSKFKMQKAFTNFEPEIQLYIKHSKTSMLGNNKQLAIRIIIIIMFAIFHYYGL